MELMLALGCLGLAAVMLYPGSKTLQRQYYRQQLRYTAYLLAADIRQMQQQTLFQPEIICTRLKSAIRISIATELSARIKSGSV